MEEGQHTEPRCLLQRVCIASSESSRIDALIHTFVFSEIKFGALLDNLPEHTDFLATGQSPTQLTVPRRSLYSQSGHYARKTYNPQNHRPQLMRSSDPLKDQTYYLSSISESGLDKALFPLADVSKIQVREIARAAGLHNASRNESMGLCFVGERRRFNDFLGMSQVTSVHLFFCKINLHFAEKYIAPRPGPILEIDTKVQLGQHNGLWTYTIGQGAGLRGLAQKLFVASKDHQKNAIYVASPESVQPSLSLSFFARVFDVCSLTCIARSHPALFTSDIISNNFTWIWRDAPPTSAFTHQGFRASVQIRHRMTTVPVTVRQRWSSNSVQITFDEPHKAVAQGQIAVLYDGDHCLGCGTIDETTSMASSIKGYQK
jgi:tRNA-5-taurinomethyluridine 2-sulfurtransferase